MIRTAILALGLCLFANVALAQNIQCPDRPTGDSSNACANTRFVQNNGGGGGGGGGSPGGANGQIQYNANGAFGGFTASGDATINTATGDVTVSSSNGTAFGTAAFQNLGSPFTQSILNTACSTASNWLWNSAGTWVCQTAGNLSLSLGLPLSVQLYAGTGTSNDSTNFQTAATACGANGGCILYCPQGYTYTIQNVTLSSGTILTGCALKQFAAGNPVLVVSSASKVKILNSSFTGNQVTTGLATAVANDNPINVLSSNDVAIEGNYMTAFGFLATLIQNSTNVRWNDNYTFGVAFGPRCRGGPSFATKSGFIFRGNVLDHTALYSLTPTANQFAVGFALESSDPIGGVNYGQCQNVVIANNIVKDFPYSQGILSHNGKNVTVTGNTMVNVSICISFNDFNSTDSNYLISIVGNTCDGTSASSLPTSSDVGIVAQGGPTSITQLITISGNVLQAFNRVSNDTGTGCILVGYATNILISNNVTKGCGNNGIVLSTAVDSFVISGNSISANTGTSVGIHGFNTGANGYIIGNQLESLTTGILFPGATAGVDYATNHCTSVTTCKNP